MRNLKILAHEESALGLLCLRRRELLAQPGTFVTEVTLNHELLMSSLVNDSERALARKSLEAHRGTSRRVLIGGLGLGYTAFESLNVPDVQYVEVVELLPEVIRWVDDGLVPLAESLKQDSRLAITHDDIYARLTRPPESRFDVILIDVDHSPDEPLGSQSAAFYTIDGLRAARGHLHPGGVLTVWSYANDAGFTERLRQVFDDVTAVEVRYGDSNGERDHEDWLFIARCGG